MLFCDQCDILYSKGKVVLNKFPREFSKYIKTNPSKISSKLYLTIIGFLKLLRSTSEIDNKENIPLCWYLTEKNILLNAKKC